ncbi:hypothetical protein N7516_005992 [Penicillium verrucosum]|uniref:uncharacterized protein n=1 Tax=Penicillium verrucosum TaxID=60171 RepID=UPI002545ADE7|nr:uncharacterized protein N7516_005992 [Penicillium verrucosum]KAJ5931503.1 hypothetical protein N7516_005992 [Penicillium verrucosum]
MFALVNHGVPTETAEAMCPWFYSSGVLYEEHSRERWISGFMRLIGTQMLDILDSEEKKNSAMEKIYLMLHYGTTGENGSQWTTYALRCVAQKP